MKFKCDSCPFECTTHAKWEAHQKATGHASYKTIRIDTLVTDKKTEEYLVQKYTEQVKFASRIAVRVSRVYDENAQAMGLPAAPDSVFSPIFASILDKVLTPAVYLIQDMPKDEKKA